MPASELRFVERCAEWERREDIRSVPRGTRGLYVLLNEQQHAHKSYYNVVYVGKSRAGFGIRRRLVLRQSSIAG